MGMVLYVLSCFFNPNLHIISPTKLSDSLERFFILDMLHLHLHVHFRSIIVHLHDIPIHHPSSNQPLLTSHASSSLGLLLFPLLHPYQLLPYLSHFLGSELFHFLG
ncbi:hypothetical protein QCA50_004620 [Cerrena zonata]|uniref:Uncharacterized protein n=1 Tax=Cerrena zonata TaxID=2478898 RepID=A0AAW0GU82_9APHY